MLNYPAISLGCWGALAGLLLAVSPLPIFRVLSCFPMVCRTDNVLTVFFLLFTRLLEWPAFIVGGTLNLVIQDSSATFAPFNLSAFGYVLVLLFWTFVGAVTRIAIR
jgi:hypothetical protein